MNCARHASGMSSCKKCLPPSRHPVRLSLAARHFRDEALLAALRHLVLVAIERQHWAMELLDGLLGLPRIGNLVRFDIAPSYRPSPKPRFYFPSERSSLGGCSESRRALRPEMRNDRECRRKKPHFPRMIGCSMNSLMPASRRIRIRSRTCASSPTTPATICVTWRSAM